MRPIPRFTEHPKIRRLSIGSSQPLLHRLRMQTLIALRWIAIVGQTMAILIVYFGYGFPLPLWECLIVISLSAFLNLFLALRYGSNVRLKDRYVALLLSFDIVQLALLIYLTGGLANPFSLLFLVPATISASTIKIHYTLWLGLLTLISITLLIPFHLPLPWSGGSDIKLPFIYLLGIWAALVCSMLFLGAYSWRIADEAREMADALFATEKVLAREQQLTALDGLAAAAAHELGTPLATIVLVAKELQREIPEGIDASEDLDLLLSQTIRCRKILANLTGGDHPGDELFERVELDAMLAEVIEPYDGDIPVKLVRLASDPPGLATPVVTRSPGIHFGLDTFVQNAVGFANSKVLVKTHWTNDKIVVVVEDDGPGFSPAVFDRLGEPYVTTRPVDPEGISSPEEEGMGLGFFIAKTLLERSGGKLVISSQTPPDHGAVITVTWPKEAIIAEAMVTETEIS